MSDRVQEVLSKRLKSLREERGLTQKMLEELAGIAPTTIGVLESGKHGTTLTLVENLATVLDVSPAYLAGWSDIKGKPIERSVEVIEKVVTVQGSSPRSNVIKWRERRR